MTQIQRTPDAQNHQKGAKLQHEVDKPSGLPCPNSSASFWHSEPNNFLLGHRTTSELPSSADTVIVGSGITGASIAHYLAASHYSSSSSSSTYDVPILLEAREVCWGATGRNGGHCQPLLFDRTPDIAAFEVANVEAVKTYIEANNVDCDWRYTTGCRTFFTPHLFEAAKHEIDNLKNENPVLAKRVQVSTDVADYGKHRVRTDSSCVGMTLTEGVGQLWPYKYVTFIVEKLVREGKLNVQTNTPVLELSLSSKPSSTGESDNSRVLIRTARGTISAKTAILATNGYTPQLLPNFSSLIVPVRCEMSALLPPHQKTTAERLPSTYGMVGYEGGNPEHDDYLVQRPFYEVNGVRRGGQLMFGGGRSVATYNCIGESDDDIIDPGEAAYLRRVLPRILDLDSGNGFDEDREDGHKYEHDHDDHKGDLQASHQWTGIKGMSKDNMPWVGRVPLSMLSNAHIGSTNSTAENDTTPTEAKDSAAIEEDEDENKDTGIYLCAGYSGHGMPNATLCAKAIVEMLTSSSSTSQTNTTPSKSATSTNPSETSTTPSQTNVGTKVKPTKNYAETCIHLIETGQLPASYLITQERLRNAQQLRSVREQDEDAGADGMGPGFLREHH